jgi:hypothetical protein
MRRREFIALAGASLASPFAAIAGARADLSPGLLVGGSAR